MPLDTSIYQNIRPPQVETPDPLGSLTKAMTLSHLSLENHQLQQQAGDQEATRSALAGAVGPDGTPDYDAAISNLQKTNPTAAMALRQQKTLQDAAQAEARQKVMKDHVQQLGFVAHMVGYAKDQDSLDAALKYAAPLVPPEVLGQIPKEYATAKPFLDRMKTASLEAKDRIEAEAKASEQNLKELAAPGERAKTQAEIGEKRAQTGKLISETPKPIDASQISPQMDPSLLLNNVPPAKQEIIGKEIKRAQDVNAAAPTIVKKMRDAMAAVSGTGALTTIAGHRPRALDALHVALAPTFADLGENARPALMEQLFKEIDPQPWDTESDLKSRMDSLLEHLKAKSSAPMAKAAGIDLAKFNSTRPYEDQGATDNELADIGKAIAKRSGGGGSGGILENTASADSGKPTPEPTIRMREPGPNGKIRLVPVSQKGEAIAAGGSVVK